MGPGGDDTIGVPSCGALATPCATVAKGLTSAVTPDGQTLWLFPGAHSSACCKPGRRCPCAIAELRAVAIRNLLRGGQHRCELQ